MPFDAICLTLAPCEVKQVVEIHGVLPAAGGTGQSSERVGRARW